MWNIPSLCSIVSAVVRRPFSGSLACYTIEMIVDVWVGCQFDLDFGQYQLLNGQWEYGWVFVRESVLLFT